MARTSSHDPEGAASSIGQSASRRRGERAGRLDGLEATTHHGSLAALRQRATRTTVHEGRRFVDNGKVVTAAGVSAGIDMSLHVVAKLLGADAARAPARYMEYPWEGENA